MKSILSLCFAASLGCGLSLAQIGVPITVPGPGNTNAPVDAGADLDPAIATDGLGNWLLTWSTDDTLGGTIETDYDILVTRSVDNGASWSAPQPLNSLAAIDRRGDHDPSLATDGLGNWVAVWRSGVNVDGAIGADDDILVSRSTDAGVTWSDQVALNSNAFTDGAYDTDAIVATSGNGTWITVWRSNDDLGSVGTDDDILFARSVDNGVTWSAAQALNTNAGTDSGDDRTPVLATDGAGIWVATWRSEDDLGATLGIDTDILFARSVDDGMTWSAPQMLNTLAPGDVVNDFEPSLATDASGNWVASWRSAEHLGGITGNDHDILESRSVDNGVTWSSPQVMNANASVDSAADAEAHVVTDGFGGWISVWRSTDDPGGSLGPDADILVGLSTDDGATWTDPELMNTNGGDDAGDDVSPVSATDRLGHWVVAWRSGDDLEGTIGLDDDILVATFRLPFANSCASDLDGDGYGFPGDPNCPLGGSEDCDDGNFDAWSEPVEVENVLGEYDPLTEEVTFSWDPNPAGATETFYDTIRSEAVPDFITTAVCIVSDDTATQAVDALAGPTPGNVFFYLIRAKNGCIDGIGTLGTSSEGVPRVSVDCP